MAHACLQCERPLPEGAQFCIYCGARSGPITQPLADAPQADPAVGATVRLPNASVPQAYLGGTVRLPTAAAIAPGLWMRPQPPGPSQTVAIYAPLHAVVDGWSGLVGQGWERVGEQRRDGRSVFSFRAARQWFPAPGYGAGVSLDLVIGAEAEADVGRERLGFRYRIGYDPPMQIVESAWRGAAGELPAIQIMAPPRIPRVSDLAERIAALPPPLAERFAKEGAVHDLLQLAADRQEQTPVGRGLVLAPVQLGWLRQYVPSLHGGLYRVKIQQPLIIAQVSFARLSQQIAAEAADLGLDTSPRATVEWWLDRHGYDGVVFTAPRQIIAFRRSQVVRVEG